MIIKDMLSALKKNIKGFTLISRRERGFTLIELIVVIGMLTILFAIVLVAVNPARQFASSRDTARRNDINAILNAVHQYAADNNGTIPTEITTSSQAISNAASDLCPLLTPTYISALPQDPSLNGGAPITSCTTYSTGYTVIKDASNRVTVSATGENTVSLSVTR